MSKMPLDAQAIHERTARLLLLASFPPPFHGTSIYFRNLADLLKTSGCLETRIVDTSDGRDDLNNLGKFDLSNVIAAIRAIGALVIECVRFHPELVWLPLSQGSMGYCRDSCFIVFARLMGAKPIVHLHGSSFKKFYDDAPFPMRWWINKTLPAASAAVVLGARLKKLLEPWIPDERIFVLPNFLPAQPATKKTLTSQVTVSYISNIYESKGIFDLLDAAAELEGNTANPFRVIVAGRFVNDPITGMDHRTALELFQERERKLKGILVFKGEVADEAHKQKLFAETDVFVLPSWNEGQPIAILEAMACGCPVVTTRGVGAMEDLVEDGVSGYLTAKQDKHALGGSLKKLIDNETIRLEMSLCGRRKFEESFSGDHYLQRIQRIVEDVLTLESNNTESCVESQV